MKHRILIVDDSECAIDGIRLYLASNGFVVDFALDGDQAIALVRQSPTKYSLVLVDFFLADGQISGVDTIREIRKLNPATLLMGLSGDKSVDTHNASLDAGAESFFVKGDVRCNELPSAKLDQG
jgi:DNA-binding response OmpR family regulator